MFRINVGDYLIDTRGPDGKPMSIPYDVKDSMAAILLNPQQQLNGTALLRSHMIAEKILNAIFSVLLEDAEYDILRRAADTTKGFSREDVELVQRIMNAERVEVKVDEGPPDVERNTQEATDDNA